MSTETHMGGTDGDVPVWFVTSTYSSKSGYKVGIWITCESMLAVFFEDEELATLSEGKSLLNVATGTEVHSRHETKKEAEEAAEFLRIQLELSK